MVHTIEDVTATTGTNVPLQSASKNVTWVRIQSPTGNTASRVGDTNISSTRGQILLATGEAYFPPCGNTANYDLAQIFIRGASSEKFAVIYGVV